MNQWTAGLGMMALVITAAHGEDSKQPDKALRPSFYTCVSAARGVTLTLNNCIGTEYEFQDKRLNTAYQRLRSSLQPQQRTALRDDERKWISHSDAACAPDASGGTASLLDTNQCQLDQTAARATVLEGRASP